MTKKIGVIVGSLRKESWNRKLAEALMKLAPASFSMEFIEIGQLPLYNQDPEDQNQPPAAWTAFREQVRRMDAILFVTPEYNRSIPAPMKNAIDVGSRPYGKSAWDGKPAAVVSASTGAIGGFGANQHLRQTLTTLNVPCMPGPEMYLGNISQVFDKESNIAKEDTRAFLQKWMDHFVAWVGRF
jgi:chromate reductase